MENMTSPISIDDLRDHQTTQELQSVEQELDGLIPTLHHVLQRITQLNARKDALQARLKESELRREDAFQKDTDFESYRGAEKDGVWARLFRSKDRE